MTTSKTFGLFFSMYSIMMLAFVFSCKKEKPVVPETKDPCECAREVTAEFTMKEAWLWGTTSVWFTETDSILRNRHVKFTAKEEGAEYKWYLGVETETTRETFRQFDNSLAGTTQPIILVVKKEPNKICFPEDDGYDSIVKYITVTPYLIIDMNNNQVDAGSAEGIFRMKADNSQDSIDIGLDFVIGTLNNTYLNIYNYDGQDSDCIESENLFGMNYREIRLKGGGIVNCKRLRGYIKRPLDGPVEMYFTTYEPGHAEYEEFHYWGRRVGSM